MNALDGTILAFCLVFIVLGLRRGLIRQIVSLGGTLVGISLAGQYGRQLATWMAGFGINDMLAQVLSFLLIILATSEVANLLGRLLRGLVGLLLLRWLDHLLGGLIGLLQALLILAVVVLVLVTFPLPLWEETVRTSELVEVLIPIGRVVVMLLPGLFERALERYNG